MPNGFTNYGDYADPIGMDNSVQVDPIGMGMPQATAPIGTGVTPPPDPAATAASLEQPVSGIPAMPVLPAPTTSQKLIAAGLAMIDADQRGVGLGGSLGAGMQAYNGQLTDTSEKALKARHMQLQEYELMGRIADRHNTELTMQRKFTAGQKIKAAYPQFADLYDADPAEALKMIAQKYPNGAPDPTAPDNSALTGDDYLKTLDPRRAQQIKSWASGQYDLNKRSKTYTQDMQDVLQFDPGATEINLAKRKATAVDFSKGSAAKDVRQLNTALGHAAKLMSLVDPLHNQDGYVGSNAVNWLKNEYNASKGKDTALKDYNSVLHNFVDESAKVYNPSGGTEGERKARTETLSPSGGPDQIKSALREQIGLMTSKLDALDSQYKNGMGTMSQKYEFLSPEARKTLIDAGMLDPADAGDKKLMPSNVVPPSMVPTPQTTPAEVTQPAAPPVNPVTQTQAGGGILDEPVAPTAAPAGPTQQQLEHTAKKYGITVEEVKAEIRKRNGGK